MTSFNRLLRIDDQRQHQCLLKTQYSTNIRAPVLSLLSCIFSFVVAVHAIPSHNLLLSLSVSSSHNLGDSDIPSSTLTPLLALVPDPRKLRSRILDLVDEQRRRRTLTTATRVLEQHICLVFVEFT